jgi:hypothetical protein
VCSDRQDNDLDGLRDCVDPDCADAVECQDEICNDGTDNDADYYVDCEDRDCFGPPDCAVETICWDWYDNDLDGLGDCADPDCADAWECAVEDCGDGVDNDGDRAADCADWDCFGVEPCTVETFCGDSYDNDADALVDCEDPDCEGALVCDPAAGIWDLMTSAELDLEGHTISFVPDDVAGYLWSVGDGVAGFAVEPGTGLEGEVLTLSDDDYAEHALGLMGFFTFYGEAFSSIFVSSNGYVTFGEGRTAYSADESNSFAAPSVMGLFTDLNPSDASTAGPARVVVDEWADMVAVTYESVPRCCGGDYAPNSFQIILTAEGVVRLVYVDLDTAPDYRPAGAGIGNGGTEPYPAETDFIP